MLENYRQVADAADALPDSVLIRMWRDGEHIRAALRVGREEETSVTDPDLALFQASLALCQCDLRGLFVWLEDEAIWQDEWGILHEPMEGRLDRGEGGATPAATLLHFRHHRACPGDHGMTRQRLDCRDKPGNDGRDGAGPGLLTGCQAAQKT